MSRRTKISVEMLLRGAVGLEWGSAMSSVLASDIATNRLSQPGEPPWEIALLYPVQGSWTESDYLELGTNRLVEFADGCIEVLPTPTTLHQPIVRFLSFRPVSRNTGSSIPRTSRLRC